MINTVLRPELQTNFERIFEKESVLSEGRVTHPTASKLFQIRLNRGFHSNCSHNHQESIATFRNYTDRLHYTTSNLSTLET